MQMGEAGMHCTCMFSKLEQTESFSSTHTWSEVPTHVDVTNADTVSGVCTSSLFWTALEAFNQEVGFCQLDVSMRQVSTGS